MQRVNKLAKIRFKGYDNSLERKTIGDIITSFSGGTPKSSNKSYYEGNIPFIRSGEVKSKQTELFISDEALENSSAKLVEKGDILYALYGATSGEVALSQINGAINQAILAIKPKPRYSSEFIMNYLKKEKDNILEKYLQGGQGNLSAAIVKGIELSFPSPDEQSAIGSLFRTLDDLLASYKDNLANYQSLKATMLSKMFPKAGKTVPEIRLDGFEGEWEINKLNKYLTVSKKKNTKKQFGKEDVLSVSGEVGIVNQIQFQGRSFAGVSVEMYSIVETGNIVYTKSPLKANPYGIIKTNYGIPGIVSTLYAVYLPNENLFPGFVERYFENDLRLNSYLKPLVNKGAKNDMKVSDENALLGNVIFPKLEEQIAISDYFMNLDRFIQSHKDKISQLETLKKKLLQDMFI